MAKHQYPSEKLDQYMLRFPDGMRDKLKDAAAKSGRSLNAEIVQRLDKTLAEDVFLETRSPEEVPHLYEPDFLQKLEAERLKMQELFDRYLGVFAGLNDKQRDGLITLLTSFKINPEAGKLLDAMDPERGGKDE